MRRFFKRFSKTGHNWPIELWPDAVTASPRRLANGDGYSSSFTIIDYPAALPFGWIEALVSPHATVSVAVHVSGVPTELAVSRLKRRRARMESTQRYLDGKGRLDDPKLDTAATDAAGLATRLATGESHMHFLSVYVTVHAPTPHDLDVACARLRSATAAHMIDLRPLTFRQTEGLISTVPLGVDLPSCSRIVDTETIGAAFPFNSADPPGPVSQQAVLYGMNLQSGAPVLWDRWAADNHNSIVVARSGAGKSYFTKTEILRQLYHGVEVSIIDPEGEYAAVSEFVGGRRTAPGSGHTINPLALPPQAGAEALTRRKMFVSTLVQTALNEPLSADEMACVDTATSTAYEEAGITSQPSTWKQTPPVMSDVVTALQKSEAPEGARLATRLAPFITGGLSGLLATESSPPSESHPHLQLWDLSGVSEELMPLTTLVVLDEIWRRLINDGQRRLIVVDEAWLLLSEGAGARFLSRCAKTTRKRNAGLMVVTQDAEDVLSSDLGHTVIANAATQILLRQASQSVAAVAETFGLSEAEREVIATARRGEALLLAGETRVAFTAEASEAEHRLCVTGLAAQTEGAGP